MSGAAGWSSRTGYTASAVSPGSTRPETRRLLHTRRVSGRAGSSGRASVRAGSFPYSSRDGDLHREGKERLMHIEPLVRLVPRLRGKALGCWCPPPPRRRHVLAALAEREEGEGDGIGSSVLLPAGVPVRPRRRGGSLGSGRRLVTAANRVLLASGQLSRLPRGALHAAHLGAADAQAPAGVAQHDLSSAFTLDRSFQERPDVTLRDAPSALFDGFSGAGIPDSCALLFLVTLYPIEPVAWTVSITNLSETGCGSILPHPIAL